MALTVRQTRSPGRQHKRPEHYLRGQLHASTALTEKDPSAIGFAMFNDPMNSTGHLGGACRIRFVAQMFVVVVPRDVAFELVSKAVGLLYNGDLACHPEGAAQSGITIF